MITSLGSLKMILPCLAAGTGISTLLLTHYLTVLAMDGREKDSVSAGRHTGMNQVTGVEHIIRRETGRHLRFLSAVKTVSMLILLLLAAFHGKIIEAAGLELFLPLCLLPCASAVCCALMKKEWKSAACRELAAYTELFVCAAHDVHAGIRMMLTCEGVDIPLRPLLLAVRDENPGISGPELLKKAGYALGSKELISAFDEKTGEKSKTGRYGKLSAFGTGISIMCYGIILILLCSFP